MRSAVRWSHCLLSTTRACMRTRSQARRPQLLNKRSFLSSSATTQSSASASSASSSSTAAASPAFPPIIRPQTNNVFLKVLHEILFYSPIQTLVGVAIGGLGATFCGAIYFLHKSEYIDASRLLQGADRIEVRVKRGNSGAEEAESQDTQVIAITDATDTPTISKPSSLLNLPLPLLTLGGWCIAFVVTAGLAYTRARLRLQFREFLQQVNFSLSTVGSDNVLRLRTIKECTLTEILPDNPAGVNMVVNGARQVQGDCPFVRLPASHYDLIMNQMLNSISPLFADGYIAEDNGLPVIKRWYYFGITFRKETIKMRKLRVVIASEALLKQLAEDPTFVPKFESPEHYVRLNTLRHMAQLYTQQQPDAPAVYKANKGETSVLQLAKVQLSIPLAISPAQAAQLDCTSS
eukprot:m.44780 g.44780  ORF g.44780 m.44780 type:complete len:406 (-) comp12131_c0_seq2:65-1282(-)